jgi:hypothetical protein
MFDLHTKKSDYTEKMKDFWTKISKKFATNSELNKISNFIINQGINETYDFRDLEYLL